MSTRSWCWWYQIVTAGRDAADQLIAARVSGSDARPRARVVGRIGDRLPLIGEVAVQVDAVGVLAGAGRRAVGVELAHEPQLHAGRGAAVGHGREDPQAGALVAVDAADEQHLARRRVGPDYAGDQPAALDRATDDHAAARDRRWPRRGGHHRQARRCRGRGREGDETPHAGWGRPPLSRTAAVSRSRAATIARTVEAGSNGPGSSSIAADERPAAEPSLERLEVGLDVDEPVRTGRRAPGRACRAAGAAPRAPRPRGRPRRRAAGRACGHPARRDAVTAARRSPSGARSAGGSRWASSASLGLGRAARAGSAWSAGASGPGGWAARACPRRADGRPPRCRRATRPPRRQRGSRSGRPPDASPSGPAPVEASTRPEGLSAAAAPAVAGGVLGEQPEDPRVALEHLGPQLLLDEPRGELHEREVVRVGGVVAAGDVDRAERRRRSRGRGPARPSTASRGPRSGSARPRTPGRRGRRRARCRPRSCRRRARTSRGRG